LLDGGAHTGFRHVEHEKYNPRLLHLKRGRWNLMVEQVLMSKDSLNQSDAYIIDKGLEILVL